MEHVPEERGGRRERWAGNETTVGATRVGPKGAGCEYETKD